MAVLYTKYRPSKFSDVVGQRAIVKTLQNAVIGGKISHAYLFTGSRGTGKTTLARILAKAVNCTNPEKGEPCLKCINCQLIGESRFLDLVEIDAASNTGVDNIREVIEHIAFRPTQGKFKVYIIDEVHMLSKGAFNALLKTLEEPPEHAIFILATTEINKVPATIISRTQRFDFGKFTDQEISERLEYVVKTEKLKLEKEILAIIASESGGGLRDALTRLEKVLTLGENVGVDEARRILGVTDVKLAADLLEIIKAGQLERLPKYFETLEDHSVDFYIFTRDILNFLRKLSMQKLSKEGSSLSSESDLSLNDCIFLTRLILKAYKDIPYSPDASLPLLLACMEASERFLSKANITSQVVVNSPKEVPKTNTWSVPPKTSSTVLEQVSVSTKVGSGKLVTASEIRLRWSEVIEKIRTVNGPLSTLLKNSPVLSTSDGFIEIAVKYLFHKEQLENAKSKSVISQIVEEIYQGSIEIHAKIVKDEGEKTPTLEAVDALSVFGGEIIQ